jgi:hypothetical protein
MQHISIAKPNKSGTYFYIQHLICGEPVSYLLAGWDPHAAQWGYLCHAPHVPHLHSQPVCETADTQDLTHKVHRKSKVAHDVWPYKCVCGLQQLLISGC